MKYLFWIFLCLQVSSVSAQASLVFPIIQSDLSLQYLYFLFGPITDINPSLMGMNSVSTLMNVFVSSVIYLAIAGITFVGLQSVVIGASEGHIFGERMPDMDAPVKMGLAIAALIPNQYGFSSIQYGVMWMILNGIGLANLLWNEVIVNYSMGNTFTTEAPIAASSRTDDVTRSLMYAALATAYLEQASPNTSISQIIGESESKFYVCDVLSLQSGGVCNTDTSFVQYPVQEPTSPVHSTTTLTASTLAGILQDIMNDMTADPLIQYFITNEFSLDPTNMFGSQYCALVLNQYAQRIQQELEVFAVKPKNTQSSIEDMLAQGWMSAAFYYWDLTNGSSANPGAEAILTDLAPTPSSEVLLSIYKGNPYNALYSAKSKDISNYIDSLYTLKNTALNGSETYNQIITSGKSYGVDSMFAMTGTNLLIAAFISSDMDFYHMDYDFTVDRYSAFIQSNYKVVTNVISFMQVLLMFMFVVAVVAGVAKGLSPLFLTAVFAIISGFFLFLPFISAIAVTAAMGSVYAAALPGLIFGAAAFSWFLKVIEAIVAAPIVAMMMVFPQEDSEKQMEHVLMQLVVLILRPSLMILGLVIGSKLCQLSIMFVGGAFNQLGNSLGAITSQSDGAASGGILFLVMMYEFTTMTTITFISRAFNIINLLPDSIFMVIGVNSSDQEAENMISGFEDAGDKGAKALGNMVTILSGMGNSMNGLAKVASKNPANKMA